MSNIFLTGYKGILKVIMLFKNILMLLLNKFKIIREVNNKTNLKNYHS